MIYLANDTYTTLTKFTHPWPFYVVDDFLDNDFFNFLIELSNREDMLKLIDTYDSTNKVNIIKEGDPRKRCIYLKNYADIQQKILHIVVNHLSSLLPSNYFIVPDLVVCDPKYLYHPHRDHPEKILSIVVFLHPPRSNGTVLLEDKNAYSVMWKPNRALVFRQEDLKDGEGNHYYTNQQQYPRVTLNIYITNQNSNFITNLDSNLGTN